MYALSISGDPWPDSGKATRKDRFSTEIGIIRCIVCAPGARPEKRTPSSRNASPCFIPTSAGRRRAAHNEPGKPSGLLRLHFHAWRLELFEGKLFGLNGLPALGHGGFQCRVFTYSTRRVRADG
jgi:hypothetical protein